MDIFSSTVHSRDSSGRCVAMNHLSICCHDRSGDVTKLNCLYCVCGWFVVIRFWQMDRYRRERFFVFLDRFPIIFLYHHPFCLGVGCVSQQKLSRQNLTDFSFSLLNMIICNRIHCTTRSSCSPPKHLGSSSKISTPKI
jgi:hypothetical protein